MNIRYVGSSFLKALRLLFFLFLVALYPLFFSATPAFVGPKPHVGCVANVFFEHPHVEVCQFKILE